MKLTAVVAVLCLLATLGFAGTGNAETPSLQIVGVDCANKVVFMQDGAGVIYKVQITPQAVAICGTQSAAPTPTYTQPQSPQPAATAPSTLTTLATVILIGGILYYLSQDHLYYDDYHGHRWYYADRYYYYGGHRWCDGRVAPGAQYLDPHCW